MSISFETKYRRQILGVFDACTDDLGEPAEKVGARGGELITMDEPTVAAKSLFDPIVVEDGQDERCLANSACADQSDWCEASCETNNLLDRLFASKEEPR